MTRSTAEPDADRLMPVGAVDVTAEALADAAHEAAAGAAVIAIVGPTAGGKSDLALDLAERLRNSGQEAEIVNADAMQLYRGMDIGTAKLALRERRGVPHHEIDVLAVTEEASVAAYQRHARADVAAIQARGHLPIIVGGSGLYVRAILDRIDFPGTDPKIRRDLEEHATSAGLESLVEQLQKADPVAAAKIDSADSRRIIRALEVIALTGKPFSAALPEHVYALDSVVQIGLDVPPALLQCRITDRVDRMLAAGLVDEVRCLEQVGLRLGHTASRAIGYAQMLDYFDGRLTMAEMRERIIIKTRQLARYQRKWFRADPRVRWLAAP